MMLTLRRVGVLPRPGVVVALPRRTALSSSLSSSENGALRRESSFVHAQHRAGRFHEWRREHEIFLIATGGALGAAAMAFATYVFLLDNPNAIEKFIVNKTADAFSRALTFDARKKVFQGLPEQNARFPVPTTLEEFESLVATATSEGANPATRLLRRTSTVIMHPPSSTSTSSSLMRYEEALIPGSREALIRAWGSGVTAVLDEFDSSWMLIAKRLMRKELTAEILRFGDTGARLDALREVLPASVERDALVDEQLEAELSRMGRIPSALLERNPPSPQPTDSCDLRTRILVAAVAFYPGGANKLVQFLDSGELRMPIEGERDKVVGRALRLLHAMFHEELQHMPRVRNFVLLRALSTAIESLRPTSRPYAAYVAAIEEDLLGPLRRDARVTEDILAEVKRVFLALPSDIQARVLLCALRHPLARAPGAGPEEHAVVVRDLLSAGGVVAVKLAQMLAEDPKIPAHYRRLLGKLRDDNEPMAVAEFWHGIPPTIRDRIEALGAGLGVGSVKQVHRAWFVEGGRSFAVGVLRANVENEALASLNALEASDELGVVSQRLGRLVYGEFNLFAEGEALGEFASTSIGRHPRFRVVRVYHHSPKCLVEEIAHGRTLAQELAKEDATPEHIKKVKRLLTEYHRAVFTAFIADGLIHSDIHLGNAVLEHLHNTTNDSNNNNDNLGLVIFDVGQWERISPNDTKALLWVLGSISSLERRKALREVALASLEGVCTMMTPPSTTNNNNNSEPSSSNSSNEARKRLRLALETSYAEAIAPFEDGTFPDQRQAYMLFLRACERNGVALPKGAFSVAKMIDGMLSQCAQFKLHDVAEECMESFLRRNMSWWETGSVLKGSISTSLRLS